MPLYEYQCPKCGRFEVIQKFSDPPITECATCGAPVEKLLAAPAIQFKGSGWYITDYARKPSGKPEGKPDGKPEGKPEAAGGDGKKDGGGAPAPATKDAAKGSGSGSGSSGSST